MQTLILKEIQVGARAKICIGVCSRYIPRVVIAIIVMIRQDQRALKKSNTATFEFPIQKNLIIQTNGYGAQKSSMDLGSLQH